MLGQNWTFSSRRALAGVLGGMALAVTGCAGNYGANETVSSGVGYASTVREGRVESVREVTIKPDGTLLGTGTGAVLGGIAGSQIGGGDLENTAGGVAGAVIGGILGSQIEKSANTRPGYAYMIRFEPDGDLKEVIQGADILIQPGTPVYVTFGTDRTRVTPRY